MIRTLALAIVLMLSAAAAAQQTSENNERLRRALEVYPDADADGDGVLTLSEALAFRAKRLAGRRAGGRQDASKSAARSGQRIPPDYSDVAYGPHARNRLDLWLAKRDDGRAAPLAVFIHGGGFSGGDKSKVNAGIVRRLLDAGISVAAINYRLIDTGPHPMQMHDGARALQFLRHNCERYRLDKHRIGCFGGSAGGCMSMWLAFHDDLADADSADPVLRESTRITCAAPTAGQSCLDLDTLLEWFEVKKLSEHPSMKRFFDVASVEDLKQPEAAARMKDASPLTHLSADDPPVFASYGTRDVPVSETTAPGTWVHHPKLGIKLKEKMDALGVECHVQYPGGPDDGAYGSGIDFLIEKLNSR